MVQVTKQAVQQWVMIDYLARKHRFEETITRMERKYGMTLDEFEKHIESTEKEVFEEWDDNIDWSAAVGMLPDVLKGIEEIKKGSIEIIE
ncbi:hypothetical protein EXU85_07440 [Spirosoma sp. KCTC 42546]|uniref:hypothetical protein n=1 Tax=Spirosoma sp. KCTC 42546 TaxID=2520506 RepID=UPI00115BF146|nr:hypothetical protein [Spirosoma sp. KCTC 42546]QDK78447.1 hypothetical protein EXU85_07440 [Spirosoma sp. KCTC 42546]